MHASIVEDNEAILAEHADAVIDVKQEMIEDFPPVEKGKVASEAFSVQCRQHVVRVAFNEPMAGRLGRCVDQSLTQIAEIALLVINRNNPSFSLASYALKHVKGSAAGGKTDFEAAINIWFSCQAEQKFAFMRGTEWQPGMRGPRFIYRFSYHVCRVECRRMHSSPNIITQRHLYIALHALVLWQLAPKSERATAE